MAEYIDKEEILKMTNSYKNELGRLKADPFVKCGIETVEGFINEQPIADVVERDKVKQAIEEIEQTLYVDSLIFGELIDFKDGKISADDVIEEFNRVTRKEVLEIIKRNIGENKNESSNT
jgi:predicted CopG family antitoxin